jgi:hypothetical protein
MALCWPVGLVAAGRHIEIMQGDRAAARAAGFKRHGDVTGIPFFAKRAPVDNCQREFRGNRDTMIAFLAVDRGIWVAELMESSQGKLAVPALRLLKAENVRTRSIRKRTELMFQLARVRRTQDSARD